MRTIGIACFLSVMGSAALASGATLTVGAGKMYATPCDAIMAAGANDTIAVDPGTYTDSCSITKSGLTIKGVGGMPKIDLSGTQDPAQDKGIYVIDAANVTIENMELTGANISDGNGANGAGLRVETSGPGLTVKGCYIHDNQEGILGGASGTMTIENNEFANNGMGDGCSVGGCTHNLYISVDVDKLVFQYNWSHDIATDGHLLKSRAKSNYILYNRITGQTGHESYCVDIPQGGLVVMVGNLIEQGPNANNSTLFTWGEESLTNADKRIFLANNTFVNDAGHGTFINVTGYDAMHPMTVQFTAHNNLFVGAGTLSSTGALSADNLATMTPMFVDQANYDYHLMAGSPAIDKGVDPGMADSFSLTPTKEYQQPTSAVIRPSDGKLDVGAYEFGTSPTGSGGGGQGGSASTNAGGGTASGKPTASNGAGGAGNANGGGGSGANGDNVQGGACGCRVAGESDGSEKLGALGLLALALVAARRRRSN